jgi:hypothetical protein
VRYWRLETAYERANLTMMILKNSHARDVELFDDDWKYVARVLFDDGILVVANIDKNGMGEMRIIIINHYIVLFHNETSRKYVGPKIAMQIYSLIAGEQLDTITSIVRNYNVICQLVSNLPDLYEYKKDDDKTFYGVMERLVAKEMFSDNIFILDDQKYHLFKIHENVMLRPGGWSGS